MEKRKVKSYTEDFKQSSAKLAVESEQSISATARSLGVNEVTLHGWVKRYYSVTPHAESAGKVDAYGEIQRLKKENARLRMERDILKKAAAYFASEQL
jgi:transposase